MQIPRMILVLVPLVAVGCGSATAPSAQRRVFTGPFSGQLTINTTVVTDRTSTCQSQRSITGTMTVTLTDAADRERSSARVEGTQRETFTSCTDSAGTVPLQTTQNLTESGSGISFTSQTSNTSTTANPSTSTETISFTGTVSGTVVTGTLSYTHLVTGTSAFPGSTVRREGSTTFDVRLTQ